MSIPVPLRGPEPHRVPPLAPPLPQLVVDAGRRYRLALCDAGLACCAVEVGALEIGLASAPPPAAEQGEGEPPSVNVLVVAGTVTDAVAPALLAVWERLPEPRRVVSFGACSNTGGPYWDSYVVTKGVDQILPVDVWVPGCPPRPEALLDALRALDDVLAADGEPA